jgi:uncharacterized protein
MINRLLNIPLGNSFFLFGGRGTGKTTLLNWLLRDKNPLVLDLLLIDLYRQLQSNPELLSNLILPAKSNQRIVLIDEVQKVPQLLDLVHYHIEKDKLIFALTGSSSRKLKRGGANLLAGRAFVFRLYPMHFLEYEAKFDLQMALRWGTLPRIVEAQSDEERNLYLRSYVETYLSEEIVAEQIVRNIPPFSRFLSIAAQSNGKILSYSAIARDTNTDPSNIRNYFSILEETLLGFFLEPFHTSLRKRQRQSPKFYFFDLGVVRTLSKLIDIPLRLESKEYGNYFESFLITQIRSFLEYQGKQYQLSYLMSGDNAEVDLIIERAGLPTLLVEIKSGMQVHASVLANLIRFKNDMPSAEAVCLYGGDRKLLLEGIPVIPWQLFFREYL